MVTQIAGRKCIANACKLIHGQF